MLLTKQQNNTKKSSYISIEQSFSNNKTKKKNTNKTQNEKNTQQNKNKIVCRKREKIIFTVLTTVPTTQWRTTSELFIFYTLFCWRCLCCCCCRFVSTNMRKFHTQIHIVAHSASHITSHHLSFAYFCSHTILGLPFAAFFSPPFGFYIRSMSTYNFFFSLPFFSYCCCHRTLFSVVRFVYFFFFTSSFFSLYSNSIHYQQQEHTYTPSFYITRYFVLLSHDEKP